MIRVGEGQRRTEIRGRERERETARRQRRRYYGRSHPRLSRARPNLVSSRCAHATRSGRSSRRRSSSSCTSVSSSCVTLSNGTSDVYGGKPRFPSESELLFPPSERPAKFPRSRCDRLEGKSCTKIVKSSVSGSPLCAPQNSSFD